MTLIPTAERLLRRAERRINHTGTFTLTDRSRGSDQLVIILAGYKAHLWDLTLPRFERFLPPEADVCLLSSARRLPELEDLAERRGWSYLSTRQNHVSLVQNLGIRAHPAARYVLKLDEDILITDGMYARLRDTYQRIQDEGRYRPGFVSPVLNLNGFTYVRFLEQRGLTEEYVERFGPLIHAGGRVPPIDDGDAARWLWEHSLPFDPIADALAAEPFGYSTIPHRFNIGAILFERELWEWMNGFRVRPPAGGLGVDETQICKWCTHISHVMCVAHNAFAGHFSFGAQEAEMRAALPALREHLVLGAA